jgi:UDP-N-acetylmuramate--alanine ligase
MLSKYVTEGDYIVCLGAGNITLWASSLPGELKLLMGQGAEA